MLLLERNHVVGVHRLIDALWPIEPPETARSQVQICVSALRRALRVSGTDSAIRTVAPGYLMRVADGTVDLDQFHRSVHLAREDAAAHRVERAVQRFRSALMLWRGEPFADVDSPLVQSAVTGLIEERQSAVEACIELELALGRHEEVSHHLATLVHEYPLREKLRRLQMTALYRCGRRGEALEVYRDARRTFVRELGLEPGAELRRLERSILVDDPSLAPAPVRAGAAALVPRQLPAGVAGFTGRVDQIATLRTVLAADPRVAPGRHPRIVAFSGPAGVGKTALALMLAHEVAGTYPDGQLFARLHGEDARAVEPGRILDRFLRALGVIGNAVPESVDERSELFRSLVAGRRLLVLLDDASSEAQVVPLLPGMGGCAVLVTSRRRLGALAGARQVEVDVLDRETSVRMLVAHSGRDLGGAELEAARVLVDRCGGLPLAVRIAAARLASRPHWSVSELASRVADRDHRLDELQHGDLGVRSSITLSYGGLSEPARRLFRRLGFAAVTEFASWISAPLLDTDPGQADDQLETLVDARMVDVVVNRDAARYHLHDLLAAYARERLADEEPAAERTAALGRLLGGLLHLVEEAHRRVYGGDYTVLHSSARRWLFTEPTVSTVLAHPARWMELERGTIVAAVGQAARAGLHEHAWDLVMSAVALFERGMYFDDWRDSAELALAAACRHGDRRGEAAMRYSLGALSVAQHRPVEAVAHLEAAGSIFRELGLAHGTALVLRNLAFIDRLRGRLQQAIVGYQHALELFQSVGDRVAEAHVLIGLSRIEAERYHPAAAQRLLEQALAICRSTGNERVAAQATHGLGELRLVENDLEGAQRYFDAVCHAVGESGDRIGEAYALAGLGAVALRDGRSAIAVSRLSAGLDLARDTGDRLVEARLLMMLGQAYLADRRPTMATSLLTDALRTFQQLGAGLWQARTLDLLGTVHIASGDPDAARRAWRDALDLLKATDPAAGQVLATRLSTQIEGGVEAAAHG